MVHQSVTEDEIARIISRWTGILWQNLQKENVPRSSIWKMSSING